MSDTGKDGNLIPDDVQDNYARLRDERGWSWEQMGEQFDKDDQPRLAAWAREQAGTDPASAPKRRGRPPKSTAAVPLASLTTAAGAPTEGDGAPLET